MMGAKCSDCSGDIQHLECQCVSHSRHLGDAFIGREAFNRLLWSARKPVIVEFDPPIPEGAEQRGIEYVFVTGGWHVRFEHPSLPATLEGQPVPIVSRAKVWTQLETDSLAMKIEKEFPIQFEERGPEPIDVSKNPPREARIETKRIEHRPQAGPMPKFFTTAPMADPPKLDDLDAAIERLAKVDTRMPRPGCQCRECQTLPRPVVQAPAGITIKDCTVENTPGTGYVVPQAEAKVASVDIGKAQKTPWRAQTHCADCWEYVDYERRTPTETGWMICCTCAVIRSRKKDALREASMGEAAWRAGAPQPDDADMPLTVEGGDERQARG